MAPNSETTVQAIFSPLANKRHEIRLVNLHPAASEDDPVVCSLDTVELTHQHQRYESLSWCWGDPNDTECVLLQSETWNAPRNLVVALRAIRESYEFRTLWVDALCINQSLSSAALRERGHQVQLMKDIYTNAQGVVVWLGQAQPWTDVFFSSLKLLANMSKSTAQASWEMKRHGREEGSKDLVFMKWLWELIRRPWWRRAWILQEIILARSATLVCGSYEIVVQDLFGAFIAIQNSWKKLDLSRADAERFVSWNAYVEMLENLHAFGVSGLLKSHLPEVQQVDLIDGQNGRAVFVTLANVLTSCRFQLATDPRDMIYGFLGIMPEGISQRVQPQYEKSFESVYTQTAFTIIEQTLSLFILSQAQISTVPLAQENNRLPSWVPDWSLPRRQVGYSMTNRARSRLERERLFNASGARRTQASLVDNCLLRIEGLHTATVLQTFKLWERDASGAQVPNLTFIAQWTKNAAAASATAGASPFQNPSEIHSAWWRTFMHDMQPTETSSATARCTTDNIEKCEAWRVSYQASQASSSPSPPFPFPSLVHPRSWTAIRFFTATKITSIDGKSSIDIGLGNTAIIPGDHILVLAGGSHPFALRPTGTRETDDGGGGGDDVPTYRVVCEVYLDGIMDGELPAAAATATMTNERGAGIEVTGEMWKDVVLA